MSIIKVADFYYGSVLTIIFSNKITTDVVESRLDKHIYDSASKNMDYRVFIKYWTDKKEVKITDDNNLYLN